MNEDERAAAEAALWAANVDGVQRAKAAHARARGVWARVGSSSTREETAILRRCVVAGRRPTPEEADHLERLDLARTRARDDVEAAAAQLFAARERFKGGVTPEMIEEARQ